MTGCLNPISVKCRFFRFFLRVYTWDVRLAMGLRVRFYQNTGFGWDILELQ